MKISHFFRFALIAITFADHTSFAADETEIALATRVTARAEAAAAALVAACTAARIHTDAFFATTRADRLILVISHDYAHADAMHITHDVDQALTPHIITLASVPHALHGTAIFCTIADATIYARIRAATAILASRTHHEDYPIATLARAYASALTVATHVCCAISSDTRTYAAACTFHNLGIGDVTALYALDTTFMTDSVLIDTIRSLITRTARAYSVALHTEGHAASITAQTKAALTELNRRVDTYTAHARAYAARVRDSDMTDGRSSALTAARTAARAAAHALETAITDNEAATDASLQNAIFFATESNPTTGAAVRAYVAAFHAAAARISPSP